MKKIFFIALMLLVVSCTPAATEVPDSEMELPAAELDINVPVTGQTETAKLVTAPAPTRKSSLSPAKTATASGCMAILQPENGASFTGGKQITFRWEAKAGAQYYILYLTRPGGLLDKFRTTETSITKEIKTSPAGTEYKWRVEAYDQKDHLLCTPDTFILGMLQAGQRSKTLEGLTQAITPTPTPTNTPTDLPPTATRVPTNTPIAPEPPFTPTAEPTDTPIVPEPPFTATPTDTPIVPPVEFTPPPDPTDPPPTEPPPPTDPAPTGTIGMDKRPLSRSRFLF